MIAEQRGTAQAESLLEDLGFNTLPIKPKEVADEINDSSFQLVLESHAFDTDKILGKAIGNSQGAVVYINSKIEDKGRFNFTSAHELGHVCMHIMEGKKQSFECGSKEMNSYYDNPQEKEANGFASGLLMPKKLVAPLTDRDINWFNIQLIKKNCGTSLESSFRRMATIYKEPSALIVHQNGKFKRFVTSNNFSFFLNKSPLTEDQNLLCINAISENLPNDFETVDAIDWVSPDLKEERLQSIYSSSISLKNNITYTLLKYDEDCFSENL